MEVTGNTTTCPANVPWYTYIPVLAIVKVVVVAAVFTTVHAGKKLFPRMFPFADHPAHEEAVGVVVTVAEFVPPAEIGTRVTKITFVPFVVNTCPAVPVEVWPVPLFAIESDEDHAETPPPELRKNCPDEPEPV